MVIGISGRLGSGKDTVGSIIQCLTLPVERGEYIGFQTYDNATLERNSPFKIKKFAGKLKTIASLLTGIPVEKFEDQEFKKLPMGLEWEMTYREFLQKLGTEAMRDGLHKEVWVNALFADYKGQKNTDSSFSHPNWIITDMRFPNEMEAVELREGLTIRVVRNNGTRAIDINPHASETALDNAKFDYTIENDGTLDELVEKVRAILIREKIIS